tara:strand:- start:1997 stop:3031 length:1035 start_codon:yes stop_codon:yes gene_type:complete
MKQKYDVLIIGQGIAGSCLAYSLVQQGISTHIISSPIKPNASRIAGGLIQRISGNFLSLPDLVQDHFDDAVLFYNNLNSVFKIPIIQNYPTFRILDSSQIKLWEKKCSQKRYSAYLPLDLSPFSINQQTHQAIKFNETYVVNTELLLTLFTNFFIKKNMLTLYTLQEHELTFKKDRVEFNNITANYVIFCVGSFLKEWSLFKNFSMTNSKGDILSLRLHNPEKQVIQSDKWLAPAEDNLFKFGSTYEQDSSLAPKKSNYYELCSSLDRLGFCDYSIHHIASAHRCTFYDYKPSMGFLSSIPQVGIFSGFSSKGYITAPSLAQQWSRTFPGITNKTLLPHRLNRR